VTDMRSVPLGSTDDGRLVIPATVNGRQIGLLARPWHTLLETLRDQAGLYGVREERRRAERTAS